MHAWPINSAKDIHVITDSQGLLSVIEILNKRIIDKHFLRSKGCHFITFHT